MESQESKLAGQLPNCSALSLHDLDKLDSSVFAYAIRDLSTLNQRDIDAISGFSSSIGPSDDK